MGAFFGCFVIAIMILHIADFFMTNFFNPALDHLKRIADALEDDGDDKNMDIEGNDKE